MTHLPPYHLSSKREKSVWIFFPFLFFLMAIYSCGVKGFDPASKVDGVRILAAKADKPYVAPGEQVQLELLIADARAEKKREVQVAWIPFLCINPKNDAYYNCFSDLLNTPNSGSTGGLGGLAYGQDLTPILPKGNRYSFKAPEGIIQERKGVTDPYGLVILFNMACAGRITFVQPDPSQGVQAPPLACTDEEGTKLSPNDYVIGLTRIYVYDTKKNNNPELSYLTFDGVSVDPIKGIELERCTKKEESDCKEHKLDAVISDSSYELNEGEKREDGTSLNEIVWASYFSTHGRIADDIRLLADARAGKVSDSATKIYGSAEVGSGTLWVVIKDNRGGSVWTSVPITVKE